MAYQHTAVFDHPVDEVFAWHARPGTLTRLLPPWQPIKVASESASLADGEAVLALPGRVQWRACHDPATYEPGHRFTDELATPVLSQLVGWRHTHSFLDEPGQRTRINDTVETRVPDRLLEATFAYRTRQLRDDLAAHSRWHADTREPLTVAVSGSTGLVGSALTALLTTGGHRVVRLVRHDPVGFDRLWRPNQPAGDLLDGVDAVVHLAGASIAGRFSSSHKQAVRSSRVEPTACLPRSRHRPAFGSS